MRAIWEYPFAVREEFSLRMPQNAHVLSVQAQGDEEHLFLWALVETTSPAEKRVFAVVRTGHSLPDNILAKNFIGTFQLAGGRFVGHVFEVA